MRKFILVTAIFASFLSSAVALERKHVPVPAPRPEIATDLRPEHGSGGPFSGARSITITMAKEVDFTKDQGPLPYMAPWQNAFGWDAQKMIAMSALAQSQYEDPSKAVLHNLNKKEAEQTLKRLQEEFLPKNARPSYPSMAWTGVQTPFGQFLLLLGAIIAASGLLYWFDHRKIVEARVQANQSV